MVTLRVMSHARTIKVRGTTGRTDEELCSKVTLLLNYLLPVWPLTT